MSRSKKFSAEEIMNLTDGGYQIFENELGFIPVNRNVSAPWREDPSPSVRIKQYDFDGLWRYTDYGGDCTKGDAISFIMKAYNLSYAEALEKIQGDLGLIKNKKAYTRIIQKPQFFPEEILYEFNEQPFLKEHHKYWNKYEMSEEFVREEGDIYAVKKWAVNKVVQSIPQGEIMFAYVYKDYGGKETGQVKFLRIGPDVKKEFKWRTNVPNSELWYAYKYIGKRVDKLFVSKSNKDAMCLVKNELYSIATNSENDVILASNMPKIQEICPNIIINFGSDEQGRMTSKNVAKQFNVKEFYTPPSLAPEGVNDNAEYIKEFGNELFKQLLKERRLL